MRATAIDFDSRALQLLEQANLEWEFIADNVKELTPAHASQYDALSVLNPRVTAATLSGPDRRVKIVARMGVGYDSIDVPTCTANGIILTNTPDGVRRPVATSILLLILALSHKILTKDRITRAGRWAETTMHMGDGLTGKTVGSIGMGNIGSELFRLLAPLEMVHLAHDPYAKAEDAARLGVRLTDKDTLLRQSDFVCVNTPLTPETRHMVGDREFALMKPTAYFINTAADRWWMRNALYAALVETAIAGAALDVFEQADRRRSPAGEARQREPDAHSYAGPTSLPQQRRKRFSIDRRGRQRQDADVRRQSRRPEAPWTCREIGLILVSLIN